MLAVEASLNALASGSTWVLNIIGEKNVIVTKFRTMICAKVMTYSCSPHLFLLQILISKFLHYLLYEIIVH